MNCKKTFKKIKFIKNKTNKRFEININLPPVVCVCKISKITETINIRVKYVPSSNLIEITSFREAYENKHLNITFEQFVSKMFDFLEKNLKPESLEVEVCRNDGKIVDWSVSYSNFKK